MWPLQTHARRGLEERHARGVKPASTCAVAALVAAATLALVGCDDSTPYVLTVTISGSTTAGELDLITGTASIPEGEVLPQQPADLCVQLSTVSGTLSCGQQDCSCPGVDASASNLACLSVPTSIPRRVFAAYQVVTGGSHDVILGKLFHAKCSEVNGASLLSTDGVEIGVTLDGGT